MEDKMELGSRRPGGMGSSLKEQASRMTLRNVRKQGHTYVELREDGKNFIFFCTLCLSPCYSDVVLFDHLKGNLHRQRYVAAKATLLRSNPWPFDDGLHFFHTTNENVSQLVTSNGNPVKQHVEINDNNYMNPSRVRWNPGSDKEHSSVNGGDCDMLIPGVLLKDEISQLKATFIGFGQIGARFFKKDGILKGISRIWCEWLGKKDPADEHIFTIPEHDFAAVVFSYSYEEHLFDDIKLLLSSKANSKMVNYKIQRKKGKCNSIQEDTSESSGNLCASFDECSLSAHSSPRFLMDRCDDTRNISSKTLRRELRRQHQMVSERTCDICQHKMLPGKDVAALVNMKTERLACYHRNEYGVFHMFHISCLIHWILLCEYEMYRNHIVADNQVKPKTRRGSKRKRRVVERGKGNDNDAKSKQNNIRSVFCPECQGTGTITEGDAVEKPSIPLSELFKFKIKAIDAHKAWMKSPEALQNCSTGFNFFTKPGETVQENVPPLKLLHFYRMVQ